MFHKFSKEKPQSTLDQIEKGLWVDFVETGARPQRMGYGHLSEKERDGGYNLGTETFSAVILLAMYDAFLQFAVSPYDLPGRILGSLVPPVSDRFRIIHVDMLGPTIGVFAIFTVLRFNLADKEHHCSPEFAVVCYSLSFIAITYILLRCCQAAITPTQFITLFGYSLFGPVFTLTFSIVIDRERSNIVFFMCLAFFGGLSTLRVVLVILASLRIPAARLVICTFVALAQLLFTVYLHFSFLHPTFSYGGAGEVEN